MDTSSPRLQPRAPAKRGRPSRRADIFAAALRLFRKQGFHATSLNDIGAAAGVAGTAIYAHCKTKQTLLTDAIAEGADRIRQGMVDALADETQSPAARLERLTRAYVEVVLENADMNACYVLEARYLGDTARGRLVRGERGLRKLWEDALLALRPELSSDQARVMVQMAIFAVVALCVHQSRIEHAQLVELATAQVLGALHGPIPTS